MQSKYLMVTGAAIVLSFSLSAPAKAQMLPTSTRGKSPIRLKFGGFIPGTSGTRKSVKSLYLGGGLTYDLVRTKPENVVLSAFLDVNGDSNTDSQLSSKIFSIGFGPEYRFYLNGDNAPLKFYFGSGVGLYVIAAQNDYFRGRLIATKEDTFGKFGAKLMGGLELRSGFFGELSYTSITSTNDLNAGGVSAVLGFRL